MDATLSQLLEYIFEAQAHIQKLEAENVRLREVVRQVPAPDFHAPETGEPNDQSAQ